MLREAIYQAESILRVYNTLAPEMLAGKIAVCLENLPVLDAELYHLEI